MPWTLLMPAARERKSKFTASVKEKLVKLLDDKASQLKVNRSEAVAEAIELWLQRQAEQEEEAYFATAANDMNEDARAWNVTTTNSSQHIWE